MVAHGKILQFLVQVSIVVVGHKSPPPPQGIHFIPILIVSFIFLLLFTLYNKLVLQVIT